MASTEAKSQKQSSNDAVQAQSIADTPWYFVCNHCNAKWFSYKREENCPRCQATSRSWERLLPPWLASCDS